MSLLSNRTLHLRVEPHAVNGVLRSREFTKRMHTQAQSAMPHREALATSDTLHDYGSSALVQAISFVVSELVPTRPTSRVAACVSLADSHTHFDVASGDFSASSDRQLDAIAAACVEEILGEHASEQAVRWQLQADMQHLLIASIDSHLLDTIFQTIASHQLSIRSLQPDFCARWNQHESSRSVRSSIFATISDDHLVAAYSRNGSIVGLTSGRIVNGLDERVDRFIASLGQDLEDVASFTLVTSQPQEAAFSARWSVINADPGEIT